MSLSFNAKQGQRIDLWLKETKPAREPLFSIHVESEVVFKIKTAPLLLFLFYLDSLWKSSPMRAASVARDDIIRAMH